jgi:hypothetical protein
MISKIGTINGTLLINDPSASNTADFWLSATNNANGANFRITGNGTLTPIKTMRVYNGSFEILNSSYSYSILHIDDNGNATVPGSLNIAGIQSTSAVSFGSSAASSTTDLTKHINLYGGTYGLNVTSGNLNLVSNGNFQFVYGPTTFVAASLTSSGNLTIANAFTALNGTFAGNLGIGGNVTATGGILGVNTNSNASAGNVGEYLSFSGSSASTTSLTTGTAANVATLSLTAGDWDVWANISYVAGTSTSTTAFIGWLSTTSATLPTNPNSGAFFSTIGTTHTNTANGPTFSVGKIRLSIASTTNVYLSTQCAFTASTQSGYGFIGARRAR